MNECCELRAQGVIGSNGSMIVGAARAMNSGVMCGQLYPHVQVACRKACTVDDVADFPTPKGYGHEESARGKD